MRILQVFASLALCALTAQVQAAPELTQKQVIIPDTSDVSTGRQTSFGQVMDSDGGTLVIGLPGAVSAPGAVAVYERGSNGAWSRTATLTAADGFNFDSFGNGVTIDGDTVIVTAGIRDLYVFERTHIGWVQRQKLSLGDQESITGRLDLRHGTAAVAAVDFTQHDGFGGAETVILEKRHEHFERTALLRPSGDVETFGGLGHMVALQDTGNTLLIGVPEEAAAQGAAYIFRRQGKRWTEAQKLISLNGRSGDEFGFSVDIDDRFVLIGAPDAMRGRPGNGTAYVFTRFGNTWQQQYELLPTPQEYAGGLGALGNSVAITRNALTVSAPFFAPGVVFVYERNRQLPVFAAQATDGSFLGDPLRAAGATLFAAAPNFEAGGKVIVYDTAEAPDSSSP